MSDLLLLLYDVASKLRTKAESGSDPEFYRAAAEVFKMIGFENSAAHCIQRAEHYEIEKKGEPFYDLQ